MKRRIPKAKPMNPKGRKKKKPKVELVSECDCCGAELGRQCARTAGSAVCAGSEGIATGKIDGKWMFFCNVFCAAQRAETLKRKFYSTNP